MILDELYDIAEKRTIARKLEIPIRDRLVESQRLDVAAKLAERAETFRRPGAGTTHERYSNPSLPAMTVRS